MNIFQVLQAGDACQEAFIVESIGRLQGHFREAPGDLRGVSKGSLTFSNGTRRSRGG